MGNLAIAPKIPAHRTAGLSEILLLQCRVPPMQASRGTLLITEGDFADHFLLLLKGWVGLSKTLLSGEALSDIEYLAIRPSVANGPEPAMARLRELMAASILTTQSRTSELLLRVGRGRAASSASISESSGSNRRDTGPCRPCAPRSV